MNHFRRRLRRIVLKEREMKKQEDLAGKFMNWAFGASEDENPRDYRHPKLNAVVDSVQDAQKEVPYKEMKDFLWGLNHDFANGIKIEGKHMKLTENQLRHVIRRAILLEVADDPISRYKEYVEAGRDDIKLAIDEALAIMEPFRWAYGDVMQPGVQSNLQDPDYDPMDLLRAMQKVSKIKSRFSERDSLMIGAVVKETMRGNM